MVQNIKKKNWSIFVKFMKKIDKWESFQNDFKEASFRGDFKDLWKIPPEEYINSFTWGITPNIHWRNYNQAWKKYIQNFQLKNIFGVEIEFNPNDLKIDEDAFVNDIEENFGLYGSPHSETSAIYEVATDIIKIDFESIFKLSSKLLEYKIHYKQSGSDDNLSGSLHTHISHTNISTDKMQWLSWWIILSYPKTFQKHGKQKFRSSVLEKWGHNNLFNGGIIRRNLGVEVRLNENIFPLYLIVLEDIFQHSKFFQEKLEKWYENKKEVHGRKEPKEYNFLNLSEDFKKDFPLQKVVHKQLMKRLKSKYPKAYKGFEMYFKGKTITALRWFQKHPEAVEELSKVK